MRSLARFCLILLVLALSALLPAVASAVPPSNDSPPSITADYVAIGDSVSAEPGVWTPAPAYSEYQWYSCETNSEASCSAISGASGDSYEASSADAGRYLAVQETAYSDEDEPNGAMSNLVGPVAYAPGVVANGTVGLGVRGSGSLNADGGESPYSYGSNSIFGLRLLDGMYDSISPGSPAEGWGFADAANGITGTSNRNEGDSNTEVTSFTYDADSATSVTELHGEGDTPYARVTHEFKPSSVSDFLYEVDVTIEPLTLAGITDSRYRRNVDWDIEPTEFNEYVTTLVGDSPNLRGVSDNGFTSSNPLDELSYNNTLGETYSDGPGDIGAAFDFGFGAIPFGQTKQFKMFYGAAPTRSQLMTALEDAGVETFTIASNSNPDGVETGEPAIFALGFKDVGGDPVLDSDAPTAEITGSPAKRTNLTSAQFEFTSNQDGSTFECRLDDGSWSACTSPATYEDVSADNHHKFFVRAINNGKKQAIPTMYDWDVTDRPFELYFDTYPNWWTSSTDADFVVYANQADIGDLTLECSLDAAEFASCSQSESFVDLAQGEHSFSVRASEDGVTELLTYDWTISDAIMSRFTDKPSARSNSSEPHFAWQVAGAVDGVECKLDAGDWQDCAINGDVDLEIHPGEHTFSIRAYDGAHEYQTPVTSWTWTFDETDPRITHNVPQVLNTLPFHATLTPDEPLDYFECSLDDGTWNDCADGVELDGLDNGQHKIEWEAGDLAGNGAGDTIHFYVDSEATSVASITSAPPSLTKSRAAKFEFTGASGSTFECSIDEGDFLPCTSPATYDLLSFNENHVFAVRATKNGHTQAAPTFHEWRITDRPFQLYWDSTPSKLSTDTSPNFLVGADSYNEDLLSFTCKLDGGPTFTCGQWTYLNGLEVGDHKLTLTASDQDVSEEISYEWRVIADGDLSVKLTDTPPSATKYTSAQFEWTTSGDVDHTECRLDGGSWSPCSSGAEPDGLSDGQHTFEVVAVDGSATQHGSDSYTWKVDNTPPTINTSGVPASFSLPSELPLTASEDIEQFRCSVDGVYKGDCGWPLKLTYLSLGAHTIGFVATDPAGNESDEGTFSFTLVPPSTPVDTPVTPPAPIKPGLTFKKPKAKAKKLQLTATCPVASCKVTGWVKVGKKKYKLTSKTIKNGKTGVTLKFSAKLAKATRKAKKGKSKYSVTVSGGGASTTKTGKF